MTVVYQPEPEPVHECGPNRYGNWRGHSNDVPGTVRECDECGTSWVAYEDGVEGYPGVGWRREGRVARWRRHRRTR